MNKIFLLACLSTVIFAQSYSGIIQPIKKVNLSLSTDGIINSIQIQEGQNALKNHTILNLDNKIQKLEVKRRKILLDDKTRIFYLKKEIKIVKNIYDMSKKLYNESGSISKNELDNYELKYYNLKSDFAEISNNKKRERIEYNLEKERLKLHSLKAPFNGMVTNIKLDIGEWGKRGEAVVEFVDSTRCFVETYINESEVRSVQLNQEYEINIQRASETIIKDGKVTYISPIADSSSGLVLIKIEFDNKNLDVIPGVIASIDINSTL